MTTWKKRPNTVALDENRIQDIAKECKMYPILVHSFLNRGYTAEELVALTNAPQTLIPTEPLNGSIQAAQKILSHLKQNSNIYVFADYDCDGVTSGFVMTDGIRKIRNAIGSTSKIMLHYPERVAGYGLSMAFCERVAGIADLVITVDNGITKQNEVDCNQVQELIDMDMKVEVEVEVEVEAMFHRKRQTIRWIE